MNIEDSKASVFTFISALVLSFGLMFLFIGFGNFYSPSKPSISGGGSYTYIGSDLLFLAAVMILTSIIIQIFSLAIAYKEYRNDLITKDKKNFHLFVLIIQIFIFFTVFFINTSNYLYIS